MPDLHPQDHPSVGSLEVTYGWLLRLALRRLGSEVLSTESFDLTDPVTLERAKEMIARAIRRLVAAKVDWSFMRQTVTLSLTDDAGANHIVSADTARYFMPWYFNGQSAPQWIYSSSGPRKSVRIVPIREVEQLRGGATPSEGSPDVCGFRKLPQTSNLQDRADLWEAVFYPTPDAAYTVSIPVRAAPTGMAKEGDRFFAGDHYARALIACVEYECERERPTGPGVMELMVGDMREALAEAIRNDNENKPAAVGTIAPVFNLDVGPLADVQTPPETTLSYNSTVLSL